jgi:hypothetical protein
MANMTWHNMRGEEEGDPDRWRSEGSAMRTTKVCDRVQDPSDSPQEDDSLCPLSPLCLSRHYLQSCAKIAEVPAEYRQITVPARDICLYCLRGITSGDLICIRCGGVGYRETGTLAV